VKTKGFDFVKSGLSFVFGLLLLATLPAQALSSTPAPTPTPAGCTNVGIASPLNGATVVSPVTVMPSYTGCPGWPGSTGFTRVEQSSPSPMHYDGNPGTTNTTVPLAPGVYKIYITLWSNSVNPIGDGTASPITITVLGAIPTPSPTPIHTASPTPISTASPTPVPVGCTNVAIASPLNGATVTSPVTVMPSFTGCAGWPGSTGFTRVEQSSPSPMHYDGNPGTTNTTVPLAPGVYKIYITLWSNSVNPIGDGTANPITITVSGKNPSPTPAPSATPTPTPKPTATPTSTPTPTPAATPTPKVGGTTPLRANDFPGTMGVDTKLIQGDNPTGAQNGFAYLGVRLGRDDATHDTTRQQELCNIHAATGVKWHELPIVDADPNNIPNTKAELEFLNACGALYEVEGPNEPNNFHFVYQGKACDSTTYLGCANYMRDLYAMVKADPLISSYRVLGMTEVGQESENQGLQFLTIPAGAGAVQPDGTVYADVANVHNYFQGNGIAGQVPEDNHIFWAESVAKGGDIGYAGLFDVYGEYWGNTWNKGFAGASTGQMDRPKETTETGWNNAPNSAGSGLSDVLKGHMIADLWFQAVLQGFSSTTVYQMNNSRLNDSGWGFFNNNGTSTVADASNALPMGVYTHNITTILADISSAFTPTPLPYSITNMPSTGYSLLLQKSNGTYELVVWGEAFASQTVTRVTVNLGKTFSTVKVYDVTGGTSPASTVSNANSVVVNISDHPIILELM
jgi:hypothetical protein